MLHISRSDSKKTTEIYFLIDKLLSIALAALTTTINRQNGLCDHVSACVYGQFKSSMLFTLNRLIDPIYG